MDYVRSTGTEWWGSLARADRHHKWGIDQIDDNGGFTVVLDLEAGRHSLKMKMGVCGYCNHDMKENEFLGGVRPVGGFL